MRATGKTARSSRPGKVLAAVLVCLAGVALVVFPQPSSELLRPWVGGADTLIIGFVGGALLLVALLMAATPATSSERPTFRRVAGITVVVAALAFLLALIWITHGVTMVSGSVAGGLVLAQVVLLGVAAVVYRDLRGRRSHGHAVAVAALSLLLPPVGLAIWGMTRTATATPTGP